MRYHIIISIIAMIGTYAGEPPATNSLSSAPESRMTTPRYIKIEVTANPTNDFRAAIATNDVRFVGYMDYALVVPGVTNYYGGYDRSNGVKIVAGTSDLISSTSFPRRVAHWYAAAYNELLLRHLKARQKK